MKFANHSMMVNNLEKWVNGVARTNENVTIESMAHIEEDDETLVIISFGGGNENGGSCSTCGCIIPMHALAYLKGKPMCGRCFVNKYQETYG